MDLLFRRGSMRTRFPVVDAFSSKSWFYNLVLMGFLAVSPLELSAKITRINPPKRPPASNNESRPMKCDGNKASSDLSKAGSVVVRLYKVPCDNINTTCHVAYQKFQDHCLDKHTLIKYSCSNNGPEERQIACPPELHCHEGACIQ